MKLTSKPSKKDLQKKVSDLLNVFVKSVITVDTKKVKKTIKRASKKIAKSVNKSFNRDLVNSKIKKDSAMKKLSFLKPHKKKIVQPSQENVLALSKNKQINILQEIKTIY